MKRSAVEGKRSFGEEREAGFSLIELITTVLIIGIIAAIAIPIFARHQEQAHLSALKSDVRSNFPLLYETNDSPRNFRSTEDVEQDLSSSPGNVLEYFVDEEGETACLQGTSVRFGKKTIYSLSSVNGILEEKECEYAEGEEPVDDSDPSPTPSPSPEPSLPEPEPSPTTPPTTSQSPAQEQPLTQMPQLKFTSTYAPQSNKLEFCYTVKIAYNTEYNHDSPTTSYLWEYKIDTRKAPFWGLNPSSDLSSTYGYKTKSYTPETGLWVVAGEGWNDISSASSGERTIGFCANRVPEPPLNTELYSASLISYAPGSDSWWACLDFNVSSTSEYPIPWQLEIDLKDYFSNIEGKQVQFSRVDAVSLDGTKYRFSGTSGNNKYVSASWPRDLSRSVCYSPGGQSWSK